MTDWQDFAACLGMNPDLFFPPRGWAGREAALAKQVCASCAVRQDCLDYAVETYQREGIWGGMTGRERSRYRARRNRKVA